MNRGIGDISQDFRKILHLPLARMEKMWYHSEVYCTSDERVVRNSFHATERAGCCKPPAWGFVAFTQELSV